MFCLSSPMIKQFFFHPCPDAFTSRIIMASSSRTVHALHNAIFLNDCPICSTGVLSATVGMHNGSADFRKPQVRMFQRFTAQFGTHMIRHCQTHWQQVIAVKNRRNIQFSVFCRNFCNICHALLQRCICCEITFQKIIRFVCFPVSFRDFIGFPLRFLANSIACTLYSSSYSLFFDIFLSSVFPFFYFIPLWLACQVLLYRISLLCFYYDFVEMIQLS